MDNNDFRARLKATTVLDGVAWKRAELLARAESEYEKTIEGNLAGFLDLANAFNCFFFETVERVNTECRPKVQKPLSAFYPQFMGRLVQNFQSLTGSQRLALSGYPLHAYTILRNTFDDAILTSACLQQVTDFYQIQGIVPGVKVEMAAVRTLRKRTEREVFEKFLGASSGLSQSTIEALKRWDQLFDFEVHGARLSMAETVDWLKGEGPLQVAPVYSQRAFSMYMNRACEIGWMAHRLIPHVQPPSVALANDWKEKWRVIDDSYRHIVEALWVDAGKPIGKAISEMVAAKFPFNCDSEFPFH